MTDDFQNKKVKGLKNGTKASSPIASRAQSVSSTAPPGKAKKGKNHKLKLRGLERRSYEGMDLDGASDVSGANV